MASTDVAIGECLTCRSKNRSNEYNVHVARSAVQATAPVIETVSSERNVHLTETKKKAPVKSLEIAKPLKLGPNNVHIAARVSEQVNEILQKRALEKDVSVSKLIRRILEAELMPKEG